MEQRSELHILLDKLDDLWEQHLNLVDAYQEAQATMAKHLSRGHFSLAQANFRSPGRTRYGQDYYDERMKASRVVHVEEDKDVRPKLSIYEDKITSKPKDLSTVTSSMEKMSVDPAKQLPTPESTPGPEIDGIELKTDDHDAIAETTEEDSERKESASRDPLHWFGILVPQELRAAQTSFKAAMGSPLIDALNTAGQLRESEVEIGRTRKAIKKAEKASSEVREHAVQAVE